MSRILNTATAVIMLGLAATGVAQAHPSNYQHHHFHAGHAGSVHSTAPGKLRPWNVLAPGVASVAPQFNDPGPQIKGYDCLAHPDYGLYNPHFC
jgi:hypothetical protein